MPKTDRDHNWVPLRVPVNLADGLTVKLCVECYTTESVVHWHNECRHDWSDLSSLEPESPARVCNRCNAIRKLPGWCSAPVVGHRNG